MIGKDITHEILEQRQFLLEYNKNPNAILANKKNLKRLCNHDVVKSAFGIKKPKWKKIIGANLYGMRIYHCKKLTKIKVIEVDNG